MTHPISERQVPFFTPVESDDYPLIKVFDSYFWFGGRVAEAIRPEALEEGSIGCKEKEGKTNQIATLLKIVSMIASLGILPLLGLIIKTIIRCSYPFHYLQTQLTLQPPVAPPLQVDFESVDLEAQRATTRNNGQARATFPPIINEERNGEVIQDPLHLEGANLEAQHAEARNNRQAPAFILPIINEERSEEVIQDPLHLEGANLEAQHAEARNNRDAANDPAADIAAIQQKESDGLTELEQIDQILTERNHAKGGEYQNLCNRLNKIDNLSREVIIDHFKTKRNLEAIAARWPRQHVDFLLAHYTSHELTTDPQLLDRTLNLKGAAFAEELVRLAQRERERVNLAEAAFAKVLMRPLYGSVNT
jgi:hypothetical protein